MDGPIRIGVIGAGWFASRRHLPDIVGNPELQLVALCRRDPEALKLLAGRFKPDAVFTDWREMVESCALDAVLIATPHDLHYEQSKECLERGIHVLLEKPMTIRSDHARELCDLAGARVLVLAVALNPPYWAHCHRIREAIRSGSIGELESLSFFWTGNADVVFNRAPIPEDLPGIVAPTMFRADPSQNGGGYLIDGGSHLISEILWVTGQQARRVACILDQLPEDRRGLVGIELESGAMATISSLGDSRFSDRRVWNIIGGSGGTITVEGFDFRTTIKAVNREAESFKESDLAPVPGPVVNFVDAIRGRAQPLSPAEHGADVVAVMEAAYQSAESGRTIQVGTR